MTLMLKKSMQSEAPILLAIQKQAFEADLRTLFDYEKIFPTFKES